MTARWDLILMGLREDFLFGTVVAPFKVCHPAWQDPLFTSTQDHCDAFLGPFDPKLLIILLFCLAFRANTSLDETKATIKHRVFVTVEKGRKVWVTFRTLFYCWHSTMDIRNQVHTLHTLYPYNGLLPILCRRIPDKAC